MNNSREQRMNGSDCDVKSNQKVDFKTVRSKVKKGFKKAGFKFKNSGKRVSGKQFNDVGWYTKNKTISDAFAKLPFNFITGNTLSGGVDTFYIPAIISFNLDWLCGSTNTTQDTSVHPDHKPVNIIDLVAMVIYGNMRRNNSGSTNNIEYLDVLISNLIASIDIYANVHYIHRIFRIANSYSWKNRLIPEDIFKNHLGINYQDFIANQALYRGRFDTLIAKAQTIRTLAKFPIIDAIKAQFSDVFKDTDTDTGREQIIISAKPYHHIYDPVGTSAEPGGTVRLLTSDDVDPWKSTFTSKGNVIYTGTPRNQTEVNNPYTLSHFLNILDAQINALITDSDFNLIQADIEKAFGDGSGYIVVDPITDVEPIKPVYSGEFNTMFHNGIFYALPSAFINSGALKVNRQNVIVNRLYQLTTTDGGRTLGYDFGWYTNFDTDGSERYGLGTRLLDIDADDPSVDDVIIMTRYRCAMADYFEQYPEWEAKYPCTALPSGKRILTITAGSNFITWGGNISCVKYDNSKAVEIYVMYMWNNSVIYDGTSASDFMKIYDEKRRALLSVESHPILPVCGMNWPTPFGEINNIRGITEAELLAIHDACFLSLWDLPERTNI